MASPNMALKTTNMTCDTTNFYTSGVVRESEFGSMFYDYTEQENMEEMDQRDMYAVEECTLDYNGIALPDTLLDMYFSQVSPQNLDAE